MIRKDADLSTPGSLASQAAPPPCRNTPSPQGFTHQGVPQAVRWQSLEHCNKQ